MNRIVTVCRGASAAVLLPDQGFELTFDAPAARMRMRTRWREAGLGHPFPEQLWVEVAGDGDNFETTVRLHDALARSAATYFSYVANAAVGALETELAFDATPGRDRHPYQQTFIRDEPVRPTGGRVITTARLARCFDAWVTVAPNDRLGRAIFHYGLALRSWRTGLEYQCLDHLWIAGENIAVCHLRRHAEPHGSEALLARSLAIDVDRPTREWRGELGAWSRRDLVFAGDVDTYREAKRASDGYEHGFLALDDVQRAAVRSAERAFGHVRRAIADLLELSADDRTWLLDLAPVDVASTRKILRGELVGQVDESGRLAPGDQEYPIIRWSSRVRSFERTGDSFAAAFTETFVPVVAPGVTFQIHSLEERGRPLPGQDPVRSDAAIQEAFDPSTADLGDVRGFLDRCLRAITPDPAATFEARGPRALLPGILSHGLALGETVATLVSDRRGVEALRIAAHLFELSTTMEWLSQAPELVDAWMDRWLRFSHHDINELGCLEVWAGRRSEVAQIPQRGPLSEPGATESSLPPWPLDAAWLQQRAADTDRRRSWWLWRLDQSLQRTVLALEARLVEGGDEVFRFATRQHDIEDLSAVAAMTVESVALLQAAVYSLLGRATPTATDNCRSEAAQVLRELPRG